MDHSALLKEIESKRHPRVEGDGVSPHRDVIQKIIKEIQALIYPDIFYDERSGAELIDSLLADLTEEIKIAFDAVGACEGDTQLKAKDIAEGLLGKLPSLLEMLDKDIKAIYDGDPAATSYKEIVICYPGYFATFAYRLAHELYVLEVPIIPRMISEFAHQKTGVDINPGATIGEYFCIDHATGIVIGETAVLGDHVKIYQGVTIGAKSFEKDENGNPVKGGKRHPNIGNNVVIYANATILGGDTFIGDGCTVGSNTWVTKSTEPGQLVI